MKNKTVRSGNTPVFISNGPNEANNTIISLTFVRSDAVAFAPALYISALGHHMIESAEEFSRKGGGGIKFIQRITTATRRFLR
jgi:hypothetical protein